MTVEWILSMGGSMKRTLVITLTIYDDDGNLEGALGVVFDGDDAFSFDMEGRPFTLNRVE